MIIVDGDFPMAHGALDLNRDLTQPVASIRAAQPGFRSNADWPDSQVMASLPEMRAGGVAAALVKIAARIARPGNPLPGYRSGEQAYAVARGQCAYYEILVQRGEAVMLTDRHAFAAHIRRWEEADHQDELPVGFVLGLEGADPILWPQHVRDWSNLGVRVVSLSHYGQNTYGHGTGTGTDGGLSPPAAELLAEMESLGISLDLTHSSDRSVWEALEIFSGRVLASHQNCRALVPGERQFPDAILAEIIRRDGVIGVSLDSWMLYKGGNDWSRPTVHRRSVFSRDAVTVEDVADHVEHICRLAGDVQHVGIGADTDGQGGCEGAPAGIDTVADYWKIADALRRRGFSENDVADVMYRNWSRFYCRTLPARTDAA